jgi:protein-tyrosine phosphatase
VPTRVLFVCSGNICRSPTAEAVFRDLVERAARTGEFDIDSAGTGGWHAGDPPDRRAIAAAAARGLTLTGTARQITARDFDDYDLIVAVDDENLEELHRIAPPGTAHRIRKLAAADVPDPYYGGPDGFADVLDRVTEAAEQLLDELRQD